MALQLVVQADDASAGGVGDTLLFHGSSLDSALALLGDPHLDSDIAAVSKLDGPPGFFLATSYADAEFFALRRAPGAVIRFSLSGAAMAALIEGGAKVQAIPGGSPPYFGGPEMWIPLSVFAIFNACIDGSAIRVSA